MSFSLLRVPIKKNRGADFHTKASHLPEGSIAIISSYRLAFFGDVGVQKERGGTCAKVL